MKERERVTRKKKECVFSSIYLVGGRLAVCRARRRTGTAALPLILSRVPPTWRGFSQAVHTLHERLQLRLQGLEPAGQSAN